jgi:molybdenum cofactor cytidylyltransferase
MGRPKLDLAIGGETILSRSLRNLLAAELDRVLVVVASGGEARSELLEPYEPHNHDERVEVVVNPSSSNDGLASSLRRGLERLPEKTRIVLVALADKPLVKPETIRTLLATFDEAGARIAHPVYRGEQGHPVLFVAELVEELLTLAGDRGGKSLLARHREEVLEIEVEDPGVCFDIDTPEDYERARRAISRSPE